MMNKLVNGDEYTREQLQEMLGQTPIKGGNWYTGYHRHDDFVFLFSTVGVPGRTGHDYGDKWLSTGLLEWFGKTDSRIGQPLIDFLASDSAIVLLFVREHDRGPFTFHGQVRVAAIFDESPVRVHWSIIP